MCTSGTDVARVKVGFSSSNEEEEAHLPTTPCNEGATRPCYDEARRELGYAMHEAGTKRKKAQEQKRRLSRCMSNLGSVPDHLKSKRRRREELQIVEVAAEAHPSVPRQISAHMKARRRVGFCGDICGISLLL